MADLRIIENTPGLLRAESGVTVQALVEALAGASDLWLTQGHPEYGIECTITVGGEFVTVVNQPDPLTAIIEARRRFDAGERDEAR